MLLKDNIIKKISVENNKERYFKEKIKHDIELDLNYVSNPKEFKKEIELDPILKLILRAKNIINEAF